MQWSNYDPNAVSRSEKLARKPVRFNIRWSGTYGARDSIDRAMVPVLQFDK